MAMSGTQVPQVDGRFSPRRNLHQLMAAGMTSGMAYCDTRAQLDITSNQTTLTNMTQKSKIFGKIRGFRTTLGIAQILPFHFLEDMRRPRKGQLPLSLGIDHLDTAGMIKIAVGQDNQVDIFPRYPQLSQLSWHVP